MNETMSNYEAPLVEVIEVEVEKGFATSDQSDSDLGYFEPGGDF